MKPARIIRCLPISVAVLGCCVTAGCERSPRLVNVAPPEVSVSRPVEREVTEYFEATGQTVAVEAVEIRARVPGHLTEVNFKEGTEVLQGDVLFQIDPRPFEAELAQAEAELASARAQLKRAEADVARTRALVPKGASSLRDLETGVAAKETAEANIKAAQAHIDQAKLQLEWSRITAPISGRISRANVTAGNLIQLVGTSSDVLTTIVTTAPMYVYFDADEGEMLRQQDAFRKRGLAPRPSDIKSLEIPVWMALATERGFAYEGVLDFFDNHVDPSTGTIKVRAVFGNRDGMLSPGLFVRVRVPYSSPKRALLITERAVASDQDTKYVLVVNDEDVVEYRAVKLGSAIDGLRIVHEGLHTTDRVIVNGIQRARPGVTVTPREVAMDSGRTAVTAQPRGDIVAEQHGG